MRTFNNRPMRFCAVCVLACRVEAVDVRFRSAWNEQLATKGPKKASLFAACASAVGPLFLSALPFKLVNDASQFVGPTILNRLLTVVAGQGANSLAAASSAAVAASAAVGPGFNGTALAATAGAASQLGADDAQDWLAWLEVPFSNGYCLAFLLFFGTTIGVLSDNQHFQRVMRAGFRLKAIVTAEVYRKVGFAGGSSATPPTVRLTYTSSTTLSTTAASLKVPRFKQQTAVLMC